MKKPVMSPVNMVASISLPIILYFPILRCCATDHSIKMRLEICEIEPIYTEDIFF